MARKRLRRLFWLIVLVGIATLLMALLPRSSTDLFSFSARPMSFMTIPSSPVLTQRVDLPAATEPGVKVTETKDCPCSRHLNDIILSDVITELATNEDVLIPFFQKYGLKAQKGLGRRLEKLDPVLEVPLMLFAPPTHAMCLPNQNRSKVFLLTPNDQLLVGSFVHFRVDLYNGCGQPRLAGRDEIRVWLKTEHGDSAVAAKVYDLHNGSYVAETVMPWSDVTFVQVSLTYPREFLRLSVELYHTMNSMRYMTEILQSGDVKERVACLPSTPVPGYASTCNFTAANGNLPWYCGHPTDKRLNCSHRATILNLPYTKPLPIPPPLDHYLEQLYECFHGPRSPDLRLIPNDIKLQAHTERGAHARPRPPCHSRPVKQSWDHPPPSGWLRHGEWESSTCTLPPLTVDRVRRCLRKRTLLFCGDSNVNKLWSQLTTMVGCDRYIDVPIVCKIDDLQSTLVMFRHAMPIGVGTSFTNLSLQSALEVTQRESYKDARDLTVVLHHYMHFTTHPIQAFRAAVKMVRTTIQEYLKEHPYVKFLIRGPHVVYNGRDFHASVGDKLGLWHRKVWEEEFKALSDRVRYLDIWDLTLASENLSNHPPPSTTLAMLKILFGYMCDAD